MLLIRYILYFIGVAMIACLLTWLEVSFPGGLKLDTPVDAGDLTGTSELSPVELIQAAILVVCGLMLGWVSVYCHSQRTIGILFGGLALIFLLHELDDFLDRYVIVNSWRVMIAIVAALTIVYCYRQWRRFRIAWFRVWPSPGLTLYFAGAIVVFAFVPFVSQETLWQSMLGDDYRRIAAVAAKEFIELLGYLLWLIGTIEYVQQARTIGHHEPQTAAAKKRAARHPKSEGRF